MGGWDASVRERQTRLPSGPDRQSHGTRQTQQEMLRSPGVDPGRGTIHDQTGVCRDLSRKNSRTEIAPGLRFPTQARLFVKIGSVNIYLTYTKTIVCAFSEIGEPHKEIEREQGGETMMLQQRLNTLSFSVLFYLFQLFDLIYSICSAMASFLFYLLLSFVLRLETAIQIT